MNDGLWFGTLGGTFCCLLYRPPVHDVLQTVLLAAIGAIVSFLVSWLLQRLQKLK